MRIVILASSLYSETGCAIAVRLAEEGYVPVGALVLSTLNRATLLRKLAQWGPRKVASYTRSKLIPNGIDGRNHETVINPHLREALTHKHGVFRSLREVAAFYGFPVAVCRDQNAPDSTTQLKEWSPDLVIFTGGNILRKPLLAMPRLGVVNIHLGLLPEIRGMSSPEWSLLNHVPPGITIHYMDAGIDTGPILQRCELPDGNRCESLGDLRHRLIALGVEKIADVVAGLDRGSISATPQPVLDSSSKNDKQFFVMHEWLQTRAAERLTKSPQPAAARTVNV